MRVPYVDLVAQNAALRDELLSAVARVIDHGGYILGDEVEAFEHALAERLGVSHVVGVSNGTDALVLALRAAGVGPGDEVITVSHSFVATATAIRLVGGTPVFIDIDPRTMLLPAEGIEPALTDATKAVLPVHLNGHPADITRIAAVCDRSGVALVEDCAQAIGAIHAGASVGTRGIGAWSMHPLKVLSALGDAGFITGGPMEELRQWRNLGLVGRGVAAHIAGNTRLDAIQAAMLGVKLKHLDRWIEARRNHATAYRAALAGVVELPPEEEPGDTCVYSAFVCRHPHRDGLIEGLRARGIDAKIHYPVAIHQMVPFADCPAHLPVTERVVNEIFSLPVTPELSVEGRGQVIEALLEVSDA